jgi:receptor-type tyrosine-protein phosphatase F
MVRTDECDGRECHQSDFLSNREVEASTIVMMTRLEERMRKKCDQYWPTRGSETYGSMTVTITATQELATYSIRTFQLSRAGRNESREIKQVQYCSWPDHDKYQTKLSVTRF